MELLYQRGIMCVLFAGELDNLTITRNKDTIIQAITKHKPKKLRLDFAHVTFVDSTGIGFILARYNQVKAYGGELVLSNLTPDVRRLFALSGLFRIIRTENTQDRRINA